MSFLLYSSVWYVFLLIYITLMILDIFDAVSYFICVHILVFSSFLYIIQFRFHLKLMISFSVSTICFSFFHIFTERWIHKLQSVFVHSDTILSQKTLEKKLYMCGRITKGELYLSYENGNLPQGNWNEKVSFLFLRHHSRMKLSVLYGGSSPF